MLIACPTCHRQLNVPDHAAGKQVRCPVPECNTVFLVPAATAPVAPARRPVPAKPAGKPAAPQPAAPAAASAASFDVAGVAAAGPEADFGFTEHTGGVRGIGLRTRVGRAASWLNWAAGSMVLFCLGVVGLFVTMFVMHNTAWATLIGAGCAPFALLPFPLVIVIGARMLTRTRRFGFAMTATVVCLAVGILALLFALGIGVLAVIQVVQVVNHGLQPGTELPLYGICGITTLAVLVAFASLFAGIVALRTLMNAEVKAVFT
jgi:hypothetical protein